MENWSNASPIYERRESIEIKTVSVSLSIYKFDQWIRLRSIANVIVIAGEAVKCGKKSEIFWNENVN